MHTFVRGTVKIDVVGEDKDLLDVSGTRSDLVTQTFDETADDKQKALLTSKWVEVMIEATKGHAAVWSVCA